MRETRLTRDRVEAAIPHLIEMGLPVRQTGAAIFVDAGMESCTIETETEFEWFMRGVRVGRIQEGK